MLSGVNDFVNCLFALTSSRVMSMANEVGSWPVARVAVTVLATAAKPGKRSLPPGRLCCRGVAGGVEAAVPNSAVSRSLVRLRTAFAATAVKLVAFWTTLLAFHSVAPSYHHSRSESV